ncbi:hypothetical protein WJX72_009097 [[Myrmecia] bisecta]|uniref:Uncharacterized protein n=1 Tax=[Myrmecia] bisecta TaxID=41462 RepID=A0AAW1QG50_9CHLO
MRLLWPKAATLPPHLSIVNLYESIPGPEKPWIPYATRSKLPRVTRQNVLNRLVAQQLALALHNQGVVTKDGPGEVARNVDMRKAAIVAATDQEADLFKRSTGKEVYLNLAARSTASAACLSLRRNTSMQPSVQLTR